MSFFDRFLGLFSKDLAMDLGTANTLIYVKKQGIVMDEPSVVAIDKRTDQPIAVGRKAKQMYGRTPDTIKAVRPMKDGVIADFEVTKKMITYFLDKGCKHKGLFHPRLMVCIPSGITQVEKRAVIDSAKQAGARKVILIEEPMAAAVGAGLPVEDEAGSMVVDIGGGTTEAAIISLSSTAYQESLRIAGDEMDEAIMKFIRYKHQLIIGPYEAESIKIKIGSAIPLEKEMTFIARGKDLVSGIPKAVVVTDSEIREALKEPVKAIVDVIERALNRTSAELAADIFARGVLLTGGGSLLRGLDTFISQELNKRITHGTNMKVSVAENPLHSVVLGSGKVLDNYKLLKKICVS
ncbi:MAG: rod shape-determining protein MreB [Candidatus Poribacteria bacterium]|nr:rod shape-determining protein MreB [Candidatus Poribacteria bacterium]